MVRPSPAPIRATSRFSPARLLAAALIALQATLAMLAVPAIVHAETVIVLGVIVNDKQERVGGALVRLYTTSTKIGRPLAEDRSSPRGVFSLYRTNISGDLGDLYVVYEEASGMAEPIRVALKPADGGRAEARTADMVVLTVTAERQLSRDEAATRVAAIAKTQAILVQAGVRDSKTANDTVQLRTRQVIAAVPNFNRSDTKDFERITIDKLKVLPFGAADISKGIRLAMEPKRDPTKGVS
jgi:hypothetical protein